MTRACSTRRTSLIAGLCAALACLLTYHGQLRAQSCEAPPVQSGRLGSLAPEASGGFPAQQFDEIEAGEPYQIVERFSVPPASEIRLDFQAYLKDEWVSWKSDFFKVEGEDRVAITHWYEELPNVAVGENSWRQFREYYTNATSAPETIALAVKVNSYNTLNVKGTYRILDRGDAGRGIDSRIEPEGALALPSERHGEVLTGYLYGDDFEDLYYLGNLPVGSLISANLRAVRDFKDREDVDDAWVRLSIVRGFCQPTTRGPEFQLAKTDNRGGERIYLGAPPNDLVAQHLTKHWEGYTDDYYVKVGRRLGRWLAYDFTVTIGPPLELLSVHFVDAAAPHATVQSVQVGEMYRAMLTFNRPLDPEEPTAAVEITTTNGDGAIPAQRDVTATTGDPAQVLTEVFKVGEPTQR